MSSEEEAPESPHPADPGYPGAWDGELVAWVATFHQRCHQGLCGDALWHGCEELEARGVGVTQWIDLAYAGHVHHWTPLCTAAACNHLGTVRELLARGASPAVRSGAKDKWWPIHCAAAYASGEVVRVLHEAGANLEECVKTGSGPLHFACREANVSAVAALLDLGADHSVRNSFGSAPIHYACLGGSIDCTRLLHEHGADLEAAGQVRADQVTVHYLQSFSIDHRPLDWQFGRRPLHMCCERGHAGLTAELLKMGAEKESTDDNLNSPLYMAARWGRVECTRVLIQHGCAIERFVRLNRRPLHAAAQSGVAGAADLLLRAGARVNCLDDHNNSPLNVAALNGHVDSAKLLLLYGADISNRGRYSRTPLHMAAEQNEGRMCRFLVEHGAPLEMADDFEDTPLMLASIFGRCAATRALLECGANPHAARGGARRALHLACEKGFADTVEVLLRFGAHPDGIHPCPRGAGSERMRDDDEDDGSRESPTMNATGTSSDGRDRIDFRRAQVQNASVGQRVLVPFMARSLSAPADATPPTLAFSRGRMGSKTLRDRRGADLAPAWWRLPGENGAAIPALSLPTPLHYVLIRKPDDTVKIVTHLMRAGADPLFHMPQDPAPLGLAMRNRDRRSFEVMLTFVARRSAFSCGRLHGWLSAGGHWTELTDDGNRDDERAAAEVAIRDTIEEFIRDPRACATRLWLKCASDEWKRRGRLLLWRFAGAGRRLNDEARVEVAYHPSEKPE